jgi:MATE family multidrug resistance protein
MQNSRFPMFIAITQNIVNIVASLCFVFVLGMKVEGVALGTLIAQYAGLFMAFALWLKYYGRLKAYIDWDGLWGGEAMRRFFSVNSDIFFRTLCLVAVTTFFTSTGARQGDVILAVNTLLMQLFTLFSYIMDGFAYAGEALAGRFIGAKNDVGLRRCIRLLFLWGIGLSLSFTILYAFLGKDFLGLLTNDTSVIESSGDYFYWVLAIPLCGFSAFLWDGIFIGATATRQMLYSMLVASATFFIMYYLFYRSMGNHALWMAFLGYLSLRGGMQWILWRYRKITMPIISN